MKEKNLISDDYKLTVKNDNFQRKLKYIVYTLAEKSTLGFHDMNSKDLHN